MSLIPYIRSLPIELQYKISSYLHCRVDGYSLWCMYGEHSCSECQQVISSIRVDGPYPPGRCPMHYATYTSVVDHCSRNLRFLLFTPFTLTSNKGQSVLCSSLCLKKHLKSIEGAVSVAYKDAKHRYKNIQMYFKSSVMLILFLKKYLRSYRINLTSRFKDPQTYFRLITLDILRQQSLKKYIE